MNRSGPKPPGVAHPIQSSRVVTSAGKRGNVAGAGGGAGGAAAGGIRVPAAATGCACAGSPYSAAGSVWRSRSSACVRSTSPITTMVISAGR